MREILTLQFGHYSNFVGTHWWNIQERSFDYDPNNVSEISHEVLFREGQIGGKLTFTPRLLLVDLKNNFGALPEKSNLYESTIQPRDIEVDWNKVELQESTKQDKTDYQRDLENQSTSGSVRSNYNFEKDVKVWSDFLYSRFHPRTINVVKEHNGNIPFDIFPLGQNLWKSEQFEEEFSDKIRNYIEECNYFQGFHVLLDAINAFAGLSTSCIEYLKDEYGKKIAAFPIIPSFYPSSKFTTDEERHKSIIDDSVRVLNLSLCMESLAQHSSVFIPLSTDSRGWRNLGHKREFNHCVYDHECYYHSSAILASALDTFTLKYRLKSGNYSLQDLDSDLTNHGRKAAAASVCLPFSLNSDASLIDCLDAWNGPLTQMITPHCVVGSDKLTQLFTLRGISENRLKTPASKTKREVDFPAYKCNNIQEMLEFYLSCTSFDSVVDVTVVNKGINTKLPYPKIFDPAVGGDGYIHVDARCEQTGVENVPVLTGLHNGAGVGDMLESLHTETKRIKYARFHQFKEAGIESDDFNECLDNLFTLRECYEENYVI